MSNRWLWNFFYIVTRSYFDLTKVLQATLILNTKSVIFVIPQKYRLCKSWPCILRILHEKRGLACLNQIYHISFVLHSLHFDAKNLICHAKLRVNVLHNTETLANNLITFMCLKSLEHFCSYIDCLTIEKCTGYSAYKTWKYVYILENYAAQTRIVNSTML